MQGQGNREGEGGRGGKGICVRQGVRGDSKGGRGGNKVLCGVKR